MKTVAVDHDAGTDIHTQVTGFTQLGWTVVHVNTWHEKAGNRTHSYRNAKIRVLWDSEGK